MSFKRYAAGIIRSPKVKAPTSKAVSDYILSSQKLRGALLPAPTGRTQCGMRRYASKRPANEKPVEMKPALVAFITAADRISDRELFAHRELIRAQIEKFLDALHRLFVMSNRVARLSRHKIRNRRENQLPRVKFAPDASKQFLALRRATRVFGSSHSPLPIVVSNFKMIMACFQRAMHYLVENHTVTFFDDHGRRLYEVVSEGPITVKQLSGGGDPSDGGRRALYFHINTTFETCEKILADTLIEVGLAQGLAYKKAAALHGMIELFKVMSGGLITDLQKYAKFEDAKDYDETGIEVGVRKICEAIFAKGSPTLNSCLNLLEEYNGALSYPCREDFSNCPAQVPLPLHRVAELFAPGDWLLNGIKKHVTAKANSLGRIFAHGSDEKARRDRRPPKVRKALDDLVPIYQDRIWKRDHKGVGFNISEFCRDEFKKLPKGLFKDAQDLRHQIEYDSKTFYI